MIRALAIACALFGGCAAKVVELGAVDAGVDAAPDAGSTCRCRIAPCRMPGDCALTGGTCGADYYCTGDFGGCATTTDCQQTATDSVCTKSAATTEACGP